jgi:hypothetical protein
MRSFHSGLYTGGSVGLTKVLKIRQSTGGKFLVANPTFVFFGDAAATCVLWLGLWSVGKGSGEVYFAAWHEVLVQA